MFAWAHINYSINSGYDCVVTYFLRLKLGMDTNMFAWGTYLLFYK